MIFVYDGPVLEFGKLVQETYRARTVATTERRARSNLAYRWKKENNRSSSASVNLPGALFVEGEEE